MSIAFFRDEDGWGLSAYTTALKNGMDAHFFDDDESLALCPAGAALFVRMSHKEAYRKKYKERVALWSDIHPMIPGKTMGVLYDDKIKQHEKLKRWMPTTYLVSGEQEAYLALRNLGQRFISKTTGGAGSKGVKFITNSEDAVKDATTRPKEFGPLIWQRFCDGNEYDLRCIVMGEERLWLKRYNREYTPLASGSGNIQPLKHRDVPPKMMTFVEAFVTEESKHYGVLHDSHIPFFGIDLIYMDGEPVMTELTTSWTLPAYYKCEFLDKRPGYYFFDVLAEQMEKKCRK